MNQKDINTFLSDLGVPWRCGRRVKSDGNCFYDSVIANLEHSDAIRDTISERATDITNVLSLKSKLLRFMEANRILHSCEPFSLYFSSELLWKI